MAAPCFPESWYADACALDFGAPPLANVDFWTLLSQAVLGIMWGGSISFPVVTY